MGGESTRRRFEKSFGSWTIEFHDGALSGYVSRLSEAMQECPDDIEGGWSGAAAENHDSIVVPTPRPRSQISDDQGIRPASICVLLYSTGRGVSNLRLGMHLFLRPYILRHSSMLLDCISAVPKNIQARDSTARLWCQGAHEFEPHRPRHNFVRVLFLLPASC